MSWNLANVEERARQHASFHIPPLEERVALAPGMLVKLVFVSNGVPGAERMWVRVTEVGDRLGMPFCGVLDNEPVTIPRLRRGDEVAFGPQHVAAIEFLLEDLSE